jgi:hypothetical protein
MEKIFFNNEVICYKTKYKSLTNKNELINHFHELMEKQPSAEYDGYIIEIDDVLISDIIQFGIDKCKEIYINDGKNIETILHDLWLNRVRKYSEIKQATTFENPIFHSHTLINHMRNLFLPDYTFVYYVQIENNLSGNEGHLMIKNKEDEIYSFLPEENDLIIMKGDLLHSPVPSVNTTQDRYVVAGNIGFKFHKQKLI